MADIPAYPRHLKAAERRAVLTLAARDVADATIRDNGINGANVNREAVIAEVAMQINVTWLAERVVTLEAEVAALRQPRKGKGTA